MNFARDVVEAAPAGRRALVTISREGERREWTFGEVAEGSARLAGTLAARGVPAWVAGQVTAGSGEAELAGVHPAGG